MRSFISFLKDESGAAASEYALILAVVAGAIVVAAKALGADIAAAIQGIANTIAAG